MNIRNKHILLILVLFVLGSAGLLYTQIYGDKKFEPSLHPCEASNENMSCEFSKKHLVIHGENIPNFAQSPNIFSVKSGLWSDPDSWSSDSVPSKHDVVLIRNGDDITYDLFSDEPIRTVGVAGILNFSDEASTRLRVTQILVFSSGTFSIAREKNRLSSNIKIEIIFNDQELLIDEKSGEIFDPYQFGVGLLVLGKIRVFGANKETPFVRLRNPVNPGDRTLSIRDMPASWEKGDRLLIPDSRQIKSSDIKVLDIAPYNQLGSRGVVEQEKWEIFNIEAIDNDLIQTVKAAVHKHPGLNEGNAYKSKRPLTPHVANLTRNIVFSSENPSGTRGHTIFFRGAQVNIQGSHFLNLGRTTIQSIDNTAESKTGEIRHIGENQIARYPVHMHHLTDPEVISNSDPTFRFIGNVIEGAKRWGISIHGSHFGQVSKNIIFRLNGAGVVTEDGSETGNIIESNFVAGIRGSGLEFDARVRGQGVGHEGAGFWLGSDNNIVRNNVVAGVGANGFSLFRTEGSKHFPDFPNLNLLSNSSQVRKISISNNEVYGAAGSGFRLWSTKNCKICRNTVEPLIDSVVWNSANGVTYDYHADYYSFDGLHIFGSESSSKGTIGVIANSSRYAEIQSADISGMDVGIEAGGNRNRSFSLKNSSITSNTGMRILTPVNWGKKGMVNIENVEFLSPANDAAIDHIIFDDRSYTNRKLKVMLKRPIIVTNHQKIKGHDFQVFKAEQDPNYIVPFNQDPALGCPEKRLTNAQCNKAYNISYGGMISSCKTKIKGIEGFSCPILK